MDAMETILSRRSIRKYTSQPVDEATIRRLLEAAMSAPSAGNQQPWQFVVIDERSILDEIPKFHPYASMLTQAPVAILICGDLTLEAFPGYWVQDCAAATENLLLAAHALGLGAVWLGLYPTEARITDTRQLLGLPESVIPLALVAVGYPADSKPAAGRFNESRVRHNRWG